MICCTAVLAELGDETIALGGVLQHVHGFMKIEFEAAPEQRPGLGAGDEDGDRAGLGGGVGIANSIDLAGCGSGGGQGATPPSSPIVVFVGVREVAGFLLGLLLLSRT